MPVPETIVLVIWLLVAALFILWWEPKRAPDQQWAELWCPRCEFVEEIAIEDAARTYCPFCGARLEAAPIEMLKVLNVRSNQTGEGVYHG
jgi:phage FluMu protein Com